jgi:cation/acetate symporter
MLTGLALTTLWVHFYKFARPDLDHPGAWLLGISPEGVGAVGALVNFAVLVAVSLRTPAPPERVQALVSSLRYPREAAPAAASRPPGAAAGGKIG